MIFQSEMSHPPILVLPILTLKHIAMKMVPNNDPSRLDSVQVEWVVEPTGANSLGQNKVALTMLIIV